MKLSDFLWTTPFLSFLIGYTLLYFLLYIPSLETPLLIGKNLTDAAKLVSDNNLNLRIIGKKEDNDLPDGTVLSQSPGPGQKIKPNHATFCVISQKAQTSITPEFINLPIELCEKKAQQHGLHIKKHMLASKYPSGLCIGQIPTPGSPLQQKTVQLYISQGSASIMLFPNIKGMRTKDVLEFFSLYNLHPTIHHRTQTEPQHECVNCKIIDQKPLPGSLVDLEKPVQIQLQVR